MSWFDLAGRNLISELDWTREEYDIAMKVTDQLKGAYYSRKPHHTLQDKTFAMLFFAGSTRTRMSFETGMTQLGGHAQFLSPGTMRMSLEDKPGAGETVKDTAKAMARFCDGIGIRLLDDAIDRYGFGDEVMRKFGEHAGVPVINMASDINHPCQSLTDIYTMHEKLEGDVKGKKIVIMWAYTPWVRGLCSVQGTALISSMYGMDVVVAHPREYDMDPVVMQQCRDLADQTGGQFTVENDLDKALAGATVVFPRNWFTKDRYDIGKEKEHEIALKYKDWCYTAKKQALTNPGYLLQCMPVDRGHEAMPDVCDNELSWIYDQAENRLHTQKAIMTLTMGGRL
ncbi:ornithine carbamoyltransferase [Candidatus Bipolaricaulota bacterium]|nr:ornithine carbamoyltransferase [Candidatus Bipolaricaulota bacterium]TFH09400.1 MAG: ornithine carbamoyltransferase [Candidatus Atribacteria bacterium]